MEDRFQEESPFSRTELLLGAEAMEKLSRTAVIVFGIGGVGSHCIEALARCGVGSLLIVDSDTVSVSNLNRQAVAYRWSIGRKKALVMKEIIAEINPKADVITDETFILPDNMENFFSKAAAALGRPSERPADYIIDAIDTVSAKIAIAEYAKAHSIPVISSMGTGNKLHPELFKIADIYETSVCPLCRVMRKELKARQIPSLKVLYSTEQPLKPQASIEPSPGKRTVPGSISFVPPAAGLIIAGEAIRDILQLS